MTFYLKSDQSSLKKYISTPEGNIINANSPDLDWQTATLNTLDSIPEISGVYIILLDNGFSSKVLYVGQSENLRRRLFEHVSNESNSKLKLFTKNSKKSIVIKWAKVHKSKLNGTEEYLCNKLSPKCNKKSPPGDKEISCNLPKLS